MSSMWRSEFRTEEFSHYLYSFSNSVFIKFPGRDIGGIWAVLLPLSKEAWIATLGLLLVVPFFLAFSYRVLKHFNITEAFSFGYGKSVYLFFNAFSQQVCIFSFI